MNNITEAKFLLQAVSSAYKSRKADDSFAKSYERAYQMLTEIEPQPKSQSKPLPPPQSNILVDKECKEKPQCQSQNSVDEKRKGTYFESSSCGRRRFRRRDHKFFSPYTEQNRCPWGFNNNRYHQRREAWCDVNSFGRPSYENGDATAFVKFPEKANHGEYNESAKSVVDTEKSNQSSDLCAANSAGNDNSVLSKKSWADMAEEEDEEELFCGRYTTFEGDDNEEVFNDENWNRNIMVQKFGTLDMKNGSESGNALWPRNHSTARRSLCFEEKAIPPDSSTGFFGSSTSPKKSSNSEDQILLMNEKDLFYQNKKPVRRNRLQVFQDITVNPGTP